MLAADCVHEEQAQDRRLQLTARKLQLLQAPHLKDR